MNLVRAMPQLSVATFTTYHSERKHKRESNFFLDIQKVLKISVGGKKKHTKHLSKMQQEPRDTRVRAANLIDGRVAAIYEDETNSEFLHV